MANTASLRVRIQRYGSNLSSMVIPNLGAFIAWGLLTAVAVSTKWPLLQDFIEPMLKYLLPVLIAFAGGRMVHDFRGGVVGATAAMGVIVAADIPMFIGAMVMGPLGGWIVKKFDRLIEGKVPPGFELLVNNFSAGIIGATLGLFGALAISPVVTLLTEFIEAGVNTIMQWGILPFVSLFIEPAKILFLNNAIGQGILSPLAAGQVAEHGKSILYLLESNPGPGMGILLAFMIFGKGSSKASAYGAGLIHFVGGIHEIYFPYVLMKPALIIATILGGMSGVYVLTLFDAGLVGVASPGSIISLLLMAAHDSYLGIILSVLVATFVSFVLASLIMKFDRQGEVDDIGAASQKMEAMKGKKSSVASHFASATTTTDQSLIIPDWSQVKKMVFACDAGLGSSAMGASLVRKKLKDAGRTDIQVSHIAISQLPTDAQLIFTHQDLTERAKEKQPEAIHVSVDNFLSHSHYDEVVEQLLSAAKKGESENNAHEEQAYPILPLSNIRLRGQAKNKKEAIREVGQMLVEHGYVTAEYIDTMYEREDMVSTYMGNLLAIPHGTEAGKHAVKHTGLSLVMYDHPLDWDGNEVLLVIGIAGQGDEHLDLLSRIATVCVDQSNVEQLLQLQNVESVQRFFDSVSDENS